MRIVVNAFLAATVAGTTRRSASLMKGDKDNHNHNIRSISTASYQANNPIEDRIEVSLANSAHDISSVVVLDGHGGWQVAEFAQTRIAGLLKSAFSKDTINNSFDNEVEALVQKVFNAIDEAYITSIKGAFEAGFGDVARVGACCLALVFTPDGKIVCGNAGDCRAVLGRRSHKLASLTGIFAENKATQNDIFEAVNLSRDHNAKEEYEKRRLKTEHPSESLSELVQCLGPNACYVKGRLQPSRSLGDLFLKRKEFNGPPRSSSDPHMSRGVHMDEPYNPPYITCVPEVSVRMRSESDDCFIVVASDGLWEVMSSDEVVEFVGKIYKKESTSPVASNEKQWPWHPKVGKKGQPTPAQMLVDEALRRVSSEYGMPLNELQRIPPGPMRRQRHDDISVAVVFLK
jgi:pyruvate dehydrogenase phosphatase